MSRLSGAALACVAGTVEGERMTTPLLAVTPIEWRWPNFRPYEIACEGSKALCVDEAAMDALQALRTAMGQPLWLNSAYRSPKHNAAIGGAPDSRHLYAQAFDVRKTGWDVADLMNEAGRVGFVIGKQYKGFVHLDMGPIRNWGITL